MSKFVMRRQHIRPPGWLAAAKWTAIVLGLLLVALWLSPSRGANEIVDGSREERAVGSFGRSEQQEMIRVEHPEKPCEHEDGPGPCYWDASEMGNGQGQSYWIDEHGAYLMDDGTVIQPSEPTHTSRLDGGRWAIHHDDDTTTEVPSREAALSSCLLDYALDECEASLDNEYRWYADMLDGEVEW